MLTIDCKIHLVLSTTHMLISATILDTCMQNWKLSVILWILSNVRHYWDPKTDEELHLEYKNHAGTFKSE